MQRGKGNQNDFTVVVFLSTCFGYWTVIRARDNAKFCVLSLSSGEFKYFSADDRFKHLTLIMPN